MPNHIHSKASIVVNGICGGDCLINNKEGLEMKSFNSLLNRKLCISQNISEVWFRQRLDPSVCNKANEVEYISDFFRERRLDNRAIFY